MPYADPERKREYYRQRYASDPAWAERERSRSLERYRLHAADPTWAANERARGRRRSRNRHDQQAAYHRALKLEALNAYGGPVCIHCGETDIGPLTLDHVHGDGAEHRRRLLGKASMGGSSFYRKLRALGWPNDPPLQVLCQHCNHAKWENEKDEVRHGQN